MATTNYPLGVPLLDQAGKVIFPITHVKNVIGAAPKDNPEFTGSIKLGDTVIFSIDPNTGKVNPLPSALGGSGSTEGVSKKAIQDAMGWTDGLVPPAQGGTGVASIAELAKLVAKALGQNEDGTIPVGKGGTGYTTTAALAKAIATALGYSEAGVVPISKGGTGYTSTAALAQAIATSLGYTTAGVVPVSKGGTGATTAANGLAALGGASAVRYEVSIPTSSWSSVSGGGYSKAITVSGMLSTDVPIVGLVSSTTLSTAKTQMEAFSCINKITTATNSITCYCLNKAPTTAITIQLLCIRGYK